MERFYVVWVGPVADWEKATVHVYFHPNIAALRSYTGNQETLPAGTTVLLLHDPRRLLFSVPPLMMIWVEGELRNGAVVLGAEPFS